MSWMLEIVGRRELCFLPSNRDADGSHRGFEQSRASGKTMVVRKRRYSDSGRVDGGVRGELRLLLFEKVVILLLQPANLVHVQRGKAILGLLLVGRKLLLLHRLQTDGGVVADANNEDASTLALAF